MALRHPIESDEIESPEGVTYLTGQAALDYFEQEIQRLLGMSGDEFLRRYDAGEYEHMEETLENRNFLEASFLISFGRSSTQEPIEYDDLDDLDSQADFIMPVAEGRALFEREVQRLVGIDPDEFIRRYDAGEYAEIEDIPENWNIFEAAFLIGFGRAK
jgi:hypothetical protein